MARITGIELGTDTCILAAVRRGRGAPRVRAAETLGPDRWPGQDSGLADRLRALRRRLKLPRPAHVVAWGLPEGATADSAVARAALRPIETAGFSITAILSPAHALAQLARTLRRTGTEPAAWLALNTYGAAIAIVQDGRVLYGRTFDWVYARGPLTSRGEQLQRYSLIAHLAPELQHGIATVRASHGAIVSTAITCGDLPDLRSLTMPLIEELDLEVETLDSLEGLSAAGQASDALADMAPAIRLACAAALAPAQRRPAAPLVNAAAAALFVGCAAWAGYAYWSLRGPVRPLVVAAPSAPEPGAAAARPIEPPRRQTPAAPPPDALRPSDAAPTSGSTEPAPLIGAAPRPVPPLPPPATADRTPENPARRRPAVRPEVPLDEPLPSVESILLDRGRRLALVGGRILRVGDRVGPRVVEEIGTDFIVLREPSGRLVRVPIRSPAAAPRER